MQSYIYKKLFSYTISRRIPISLLYHKDRCVTKRAPATLQHRIIKYLEKAISTDKTARKGIKHVIPAMKRDAENNCFVWSFETQDMDNPSPKRTLDSQVKKLSQIMSQIGSLRKIGNPEEFKMQLEIIDRESCRILDQLSFDQILMLLNKLMEIVPHWLAELSIYSKSIKRMQRMILEGSRDSLKIVNMIFLASLTQVEAAGDVLFALEYLPDMKELSLMEKCIVSLSTFKVGLKLSKENIQIIEDTIHANLATLIKNSPFLVCLLKGLRFGGPSPEFDFTPLNKKLLDTDQIYPMSLAVPILALYAEMYMLEENVVERLVEDSIFDMTRTRIAMTTVKQSDFLCRKEIKNVNRLLWATSRLNYRLSNDQMVETERFVKTHMRILSSRPKVFVGMLLSLWMLGYEKCHLIVEYCFQQKIFEPLLNASNDDQAQLNLLLECIRIEAPWIEIPSVFTRKEANYPLKNYTELKVVSEVMECIASHLNLSDIRIDCPVNGIRIYGISAKHQVFGWIHIDMLNNFTCLKNTRKPNGIMCLKLRLIKALGYFSILLSNDGVIKIESLITTIEESINLKLRELEG